VYPGTYSPLTPDKPAVLLHGGGLVITYAELDRRSARLARAWYEAGLRTGDHVAMMTSNDPRCYEVYWAALRSGLFVTAVNRHLSPDEVAYVVDDCEAVSLVVSAGLAELAEAVVPATPKVRIRLAIDGPAGSCASYEDFRDAAGAEPLPDQPRGADMLYSSGTTGRPKGIVPQLLGGQVGEVAEPIVHLCKGVYGMGPDTVYLSPAPIYHSAPLRFGAAVHCLGGTVVMMPRFDAEESLRAIEQHHVTHSQWVPTHFVRMLKLPDDRRTAYDLSSHAVAVHAAAPCPPDVKEAMLEWWGPIIYEYYSATESPGITMIGPEDWLAHPGSVGRAVLGDIKICDEDGQEVPAGQPGTIWFERDTMPFRYHADPAKTAAAQHPDHPNWATVGDLGYVDGEGYLYLTDRKAFMIISGGVNIYPAEVEGCLTLHPAVADIAVLGLPDDEMGQAVHAFVQLTPGVKPSPGLASDLMAHARDRIAHFKCPRGVTFVDSLPRTPTGKLAKHRLLAQIQTD
jgi:long-chain acyl-CoA synthetase